MSSKQREALSKIIDMICEWRTDEVMEYWQYAQLFDVADEALAEPLLNCEVGTAEEQSVRMAEFCSKQHEKSDGVMLCSGCRFHDMEGLDCQFAWGQSPYEEGEAK